MSEPLNPKEEAKFKKVAEKYGFGLVKTEYSKPNYLDKRHVSDDFLFEKITGVTSAGGYYKGGETRRHTISVYLYEGGAKHWHFKYTQTNGIYAPYGSGDNASQLNRTLERMQQEGRFDLTEGHMTNAQQIVVKLRSKDYDAANEAFAALMQEKVNKVLREERRLLLVSEANMTWWKVMLNGKEIDKIQYTSDMKADDVKRSLVNHDGYDDNIKVIKEQATKKALIREPGAPVGQSAPMHLNCDCGNKVYMPLMFTNQATVACDKCGQKYNRQGWLVEAYDLAGPVKYYTHDADETTIRSAASQTGMRIKKFGRENDGTKYVVVVMKDESNATMPDKLRTSQMWKDAVSELGLQLTEGVSDDTLRAMSPAEQTALVNRIATGKASTKDWEALKLPFETFLRYAQWTPEQMKAAAEKIRQKFNISEATYRPEGPDAWSHADESEDDSDEPQEGDVTTDDHETFYSDGKKVANNVKELKAWMKKNQYYPTVWFISDHGNAHVTNINEARELSVPEKHQLRIAKQTLNMPDAMVGVMGGPSKEEAREIIQRLTGKAVNEAAPWETSGNVKSKAYYLGHGAMKDGKKRVPAHDSNLQDYIKSSGGYGKIGDNGPNSTMQKMSDWLKGWDDANLRNDEPMTVESRQLTEAKVECLECGKVFKAPVSPGAEPKCPKCGGYDVELAEAAAGTITGGPKTGLTWRAGEVKKGGLSPSNFGRPKPFPFKKVEEAEGDNAWKLNSKLTQTSNPLNRGGLKEDELTHGLHKNCKTCGHPASEHDAEDGCGHKGCRCMQLKESRDFEVRIVKEDKMFRCTNASCDYKGEKTEAGKCPGCGKPTTPVLSEERDWTPRYTVELFSPGYRYTEAAWETKFRYGAIKSGPSAGKTGLGKPNEANLEQYVQDFENSTKPGGVNDHLGFRKITGAQIKDQQTKQIVASYRG